MKKCQMWNLLSLNENLIFDCIWSTRQTPPPLLTGPNLAPFGEESKNMIGQRKRNVSKINSEREQLRLFGTRSPIGVV